MQTTDSKSNYAYALMLEFSIMIMMNLAHPNEVLTDFTVFFGRDSIETTSLFKMVLSEIAMRVLSAHMQQDDSCSTSEKGAMLQCKPPLRGFTDPKKGRKSVLLDG